MSNASRRRQGLVALACAVAVTVTAGAGANGQKFYPDDPIARIVDAQDASGVQRAARSIWSTTRSRTCSRGPATRRRTSARRTSTRSMKCRTRAGSRTGWATVPLTVDDVVKGPGSGTGPAPGGWTVISAKNDGVMPGFTVRDSAGQVWFIKFDPPGYPAMATGTEVLVARLFWALGYHVPETHLATLRPDELTIDDEARITPPSGSRRRFKESDIRLLLRGAHRDADGSYRVVASKALEGRPVGGFRFYGMRSDDPNDVVPHEHRRELRGYGTFAAWLNHVDSKSINTLDTVVEQDGTTSRASSPAGFRIDDRQRRRLPARGVRRLGVPRRRQEDAGRDAEPSGSTSRTGGRCRCIARDPSAPSPSTTRSGIPSGGSRATRNSAFRSARLDDKFWAARRLQAFTDEMLNTLIGVGRVQRSEIRGDAVEVPDRAPQRDSSVATFRP